MQYSAEFGAPMAGGDRLAPSRTSGARVTARSPGLTRRLLRPEHERLRRPSASAARVRELIPVVTCPCPSARAGRQVPQDRGAGARRLVVRAQGLFRRAPGCRARGPLRAMRRRASGPIPPAARARLSRPPGWRAPAHEHVRAGAVGGRPGTGGDRGRRGRGQDRLRGGHRQRGARHAPRHRRPEGRGSRARGPPGRAAAARPGAFPETRVVLVRPRLHAPGGAPPGGAVAVGGAPVPSAEPRPPASPRPLLATTERVPGAGGGTPSAV